MDSELTPQERPPEDRPDATELPDTTQLERDETGEIMPRGAIAFIIFMFVFYVGYWFLTWFEIFVLRG